MDASLSPLPKKQEPAYGEKTSDEATAANPGQVDHWLCQAREGSQSALGWALEAARTYLLLFANRALDDKLKAKVGASDLVQDTFADAQRDFGQFRGHTQAEFYAWLIGILSHRLANNVRHYRLTQGRNVDRELPQQAIEAAIARLREETATPGAAAVAREDQLRVQQALGRLSEPLRSVLVERTWQGASFTEIGASRNLSAEAARKLWARAVREMHKRLLDLE
jgi:RNA polymerase sigma-70 factor (ECF subfamily)